MSGIVVVRDPVPAGAFCATVRASVKGLPGRFVHRVGFVTEGAPPETVPPATCVPPRPTALRLDAVRRTGPTSVTIRVSMSARVQGRVKATAEIGRPQRLSVRGPARRKGGRVQWTFSGAARPVPDARFMLVRAVVRRTDDGPGAMVERLLRLRPR